MTRVRSRPSRPPVRDSGGPGRRPASLARSSREGAAPVAPRLAVAGIFGAVVFGILVLRLWALTVLGGAEYAERAEQNQLRLLPAEAPRGTILDRSGRPIVTNRPAQEVALDLQDVPEQRLESVVRGLAFALGEPEPSIMEIVEAAPEGAVEPVVVAEDVPREVVGFLREHAAEFPGVTVRTRYRRAYPHGSTAAHILGQVGEVSPEELESSHTNLRPGDRVGKSGLERRYDEYLRGTDGYQAIEVDAAGIRKGERRGMPETPGRDLRTTLDLGLQRATERSLAENVARAARTADGRDANAGAAVAIDVRNGEVLAMASHPTFDANIFVTPGKDREISWLYSEKNRKQPTFNRAIAGAYPPGSIYKPITAIAGMEEGLVAPDTVIQCPPYMKILGTVFRNHDSRHLGGMQLPAALEASCDTYFYELGLEFYNHPESPLQDWSRKFGLGAPTGIDVSGEGEGLVPTPRWKREHFEGWEKEWLPGDSVNLSIGQGNLTVTPLQMAVVYAALANGGVMRTPHLGRSIHDPSGREELKLDAGRPRDLKLNPVDLTAVTEGLVRVNEGVNGTATAVWSGFPVPTAGKTGTAEKFGQSDLAWYCGFAPVEEPEIAACAFVDGGGHGGSVAGPIVRDMFAQWFDVGGAAAASPVVEGTAD